MAKRLGIATTLRKADRERFGGKLAHRADFAMVEFPRATARKEYFYDG
jgi:hypothetical protein